MSSPIRVVLVDDHAVVREGYRRLIEREAGLQVVGEATTARQACELALLLQPHVVVMDISLPGASGIEAMRRMIAQQPQLPVLIFSMYDDAIYASRALEGGARGYISKASAPDILVQAVYAVCRGERYVSADVAGKLTQAAAHAERSRLNALTPREFEVLRLLMKGESVRRIGEMLGLSEKTVANHQSTIREKLGARNGAQLAQLATAIGMPG